MTPIPRLLPYPYDTDPHGQPWYVLDIVTGDILSYKLRGRPKKGGSRRKDTPEPVAGWGPHSIVTIYDPEGRKTRRTRNSIVQDTLEHFWRTTARSTP